MSRECDKELEATVARRYEVDVMKGKANLEIRPTFINKGEIAKRLVASYNSNMSPLLETPPGADDKNSHAKAADAAKEGTVNTNSRGRLEFVLCMGDDFTDEDMFRALNGLSAPETGALFPDHVFTVTVGASTKVTLARWHLLEPEDVVECVALLAGVRAASTAGVLAVGEVNLAALSAVEGKIPRSGAGASTAQDEN